MNYPARILFQTLVKSFYKENATAFVFIFTILFYAVGSVDGAGLLDFHYSLALGMLKSNIFLLLVFLIWLFYARKCAAFVSSVLRDPYYAFLHVYNCLTGFERFRLFFFVYALLLMPVFLYSIFIAIAGWLEHLYIPAISCVLFLFIIGLCASVWTVYTFNKSGRKSISFTVIRFKNSGIASRYPFILLRFIAGTQKFTWAILKVLTCVPLYLIARNNVLSGPDIILLFLFFNFGILTNGLFVYKAREFEETYLPFYRGLPVSLLQRFLQYTFVYFIVLIPEIITLIVLPSSHLHYSYATGFLLCSFSLILLLNSLSFLYDFNRNSYLGVFTLVLAVQYISIVLLGFTFLYLLLFTLAIYLFSAGYYKYERTA